MGGGIMMGLLSSSSPQDHWPVTSAAEAVNGIVEELENSFASNGWGQMPEQFPFPCGCTYPRKYNESTSRFHKNFKWKKQQKRQQFLKYHHVP